VAYNIREAKRILYGLKRKFGIPMLAIEDNGEVHDHTTGAIVPRYDETSLNRVIVLTESDTRSFIQDLAYITSNRNFTSGGLFNQGERVLIIDGEEAFIPTLQTHFEFHDEKWRVSEIDTILNNRGHLVKVIKIAGNPTVGS